MEISELDAVSLAEALRAGDEKAATLVLEAIYPLVLRIVRNHLPRRMEEEDLIQDVLLKVLTRIDQYRGVAPFHHWVSRIALSTCLDALRKEKRRPELRWSELTQDEKVVLEELVSPREYEGGPAHLAAARELAERLLEALSPQDRIIVRMMDMEGASTAEVAALLGWGISKVKVRASRARKKLRALLVKLGEEVDTQ
ncbi:RNA polymerase sigma factor [Candidatus Methylacidithermus pantelleriae]|uniref:RNA polymerase subunit sigma-24 n=1 Tax=Candidatus Methylacidithermus pantelleriae TaxID=2744239 RepID=A0A8J2BGT1_9BACT|nr:RNA polymerase sigma factor [Candidatus Methylacidithermus pantelleriae]CAF0692481.1 RNA polymerase subunit sigma-24 [Candidatus Methylacidithermus pantelleriae]